MRDVLSVPGLLLAVLVLGLVFGAVERFARGRPLFAWLRRPGARTDLLWWLTGPLLTRTFSNVVMVVAIVLVLLATGGSLATWQAEVAAGRFPDPSPFGLGAFLRGLPPGFELLLGLFVADLVGYVVHRWFHGRRLWRFHAVHHSSTHLDWFASARVHPVNEVLSRAVQAVPLLFLGFDPRVFAVVAPLLTLYGLLLHTDVHWTFGPLRHVLASPVFHRWHHGADREARDVNFAGLFPVLDLAFGTFHMPPGRLPERLGVAGDPVPPSFLAQLAWPFRRVRRTGTDPGSKLRSFRRVVETSES